MQILLINKPMIKQAEQGNMVTTEWAAKHITVTPSYHTKPTEFDVISHIVRTRIQSSDRHFSTMYVCSEYGNYDILECTTTNKKYYK